MAKIKIIGTAYPFRGGLAAFNERMANEFAGQGHETDIETFTLQYPGFLFPGKSQYADWEAPENLTIKQTINSVNPLNWMAVGNRIRKEKPDLVVIKYWIPFMAPCFGTIIRQIKKNRHTKIICVADNIVPHEHFPGSRMLTRYFMRSLDGIVAMSQSVFNDILLFDKFMPRALSPHPLFDNFGDPLPKEEALKNLGLDPAFRYLLFFGFIRDYKGLDLLLKAFADERLRKFQVKLLVAGEFYSKPESYYKLIDELDLGELVVLKTQFISNQDVNAYFCSADMIVQPYKSATQSGVTQIGYHFNKPMLVTNVGGLAEMIPDQKIGYVVEPDIKAIADALVDFYENHREDYFSANVAEEKKKFAWPNMIQAILNVYSETLSK